MQPTPGKNFIFSAIRTIVPSAVTGVLTWLARKYDIVLDEGTQADAMLWAYGAVFGVYYLAVRLVETYVTPHISFLLGDFRKGRTEPVYPDAHATVVVPPSNPDGA